MHPCTIPMIVLTVACVVLTTLLVITMILLNKERLKSKAYMQQVVLLDQALKYVKEPTRSLTDYEKSLLEQM